MKDELRVQWEKWCRKAAADTGRSYEEIVADLKEGRAIMEIKLTIDLPKPVKP